MRCQKCGFISFDQLEQCKKCGKPFAGLPEELEGTVFDVSAPVFLRIDEQEPPGPSPQEEAESAPDGIDEAGVEDSVDLVLEDTAEEVSSTPEISEEPEAEGEGVVDLDLDEAADDLDLDLATDDADDALDLGEESEEARDEDGGIQLDLGDIDISDLAPPEEDVVEEALTLDDVRERHAGDGAPPPVPGGTGGGLADLQVDDLDLDAPAPPVAGSKAGGKLMPSVKTGTALDDFEIDLGELIGEKEK